MPLPQKRFLFVLLNNSAFSGIYAKQYLTGRIFFENSRGTGREMISFPYGALCKLNTDEEDEMSRRVEVYDTTLRDGMQGIDISFSLEEKIKVAELLDELGVDFIEGGYPDSNPKDMEFFNSGISRLELKNAQITVFGRTCLKGLSPSKDEGLFYLSRAKVETVTLFGKSWDKQVERVLETSLDENLRMIRETCAFLRDNGKRVFFDAEHFFDGFKDNPEYTLLVLEAAIEEGAERLILCDTRGGTLHWELGEIIRQVKQEINVPLGIHAHNDSGLAVANSLEALRQGVIQVQGTINGYGERCGNADLVVLLANIRHKTDWGCVKMHQIAQLTGLSRVIADILNQNYDYRQPYVGRNAFYHKAGFHVKAMMKWDESYEHVRPESVGNKRRIAVSELSGRGNVEVKAEEFGIELTESQKRDILEKVENLEDDGFQFDIADGSLELLMLRSQKRYNPPFVVNGYNVNVNRIRKKNKNREEAPDKAFIKISVGQRVHTVKETGNGPVNALDRALRSVLSRFFPVIDKINLVDFKVRTIAGNGNKKSGTEASVRVLIDFSDGEHIWTTVGVGTDLIDASKQALVDGLELAILKEPSKRRSKDFLSGLFGSWGRSKT